ncbi:MAG: cupin domain-containing protein [bacterium]
MSAQQDPAAESQPVPFVQALPNDDTPYLSLLKPGKSAKLHSGYVCLKPGENVGEHSTENYEELLVVLSGEGEVETGGIAQRRPISANQVAYNPPHTTHNVFSTGREPLRYIYIVTPVE